MLRLLLLLECDQCTEMLTSTPNTSDHPGTNWAEEIYRAEYQAEENGWSVYHSQHVCDACLMSNMAKQYQSPDSDIPF
jgi:hypothetical protein